MHWTKNNDDVLKNNAVIYQHLENCQVQKELNTLQGLLTSQNQRVYKHEILY